MGAPDLSSFIWPDADRSRQPQSSYQIDRSNPITAGLQAVINPLDRRYSTNGTLTTALNPAGLAINTAACNSNNAQAPTLAAGTGGDLTFLWVGCITGANPGLATLCPTGASSSLPNGGAYLWYSNGGYGVPSNVFALGLVDASSGADEAHYAFAQPSATTVVSVVGSIKSGTGSTIGINGALQSATVSGTRPAAPTVNGLVAGSCDPSTITGSQQTNLCAFWNRALTASEVQSLSANPWQIFQPQKLGLFVPSSGGAAVTFAANGTETSSATAGLVSGALFASAGNETTSATASLTATARFAAAGSESSASVANLAAQTFAAAGSESSSATSALTATALFAAFASEQSTASTGLTVALSASSSESSGAAAALVSGAILAAAGSETSTASGTLGTASAIGANGTELSTASASITAGALFAAAANESSFAGASLLIGNALSASATEQSTSSASLVTTAKFAASATESGASQAGIIAGGAISAAGSESSSALASISAGALFAAAANESSIGASSLVTGPVLAANATESSNASSSFGATTFLSASGIETSTATVKLGLPVVNPPTTPVYADRRIISVSGDKRTISVPAEQRTFKVAA